jgi:hypothetical protein
VWPSGPPYGVSPASVGSEPPESGSKRGFLNWRYRRHDRTTGQIKIHLRAVSIGVPCSLSTARGRIRLRLRLDGFGHPNRPMETSIDPRWAVTSPRAARTPVRPGRSARSRSATVSATGPRWRSTVSPRCRRRSTCSRRWRRYAGPDGASPSTYGTCEVCGEPVPEERLEVRASPRRSPNRCRPGAAVGRKSRESDPGRICVQASITPSSAMRMARVTVTPPSIVDRSEWRHIRRETLQCH